MLGVLAHPPKKQPMNKDGVATAFELIVEEIESVVSDVAEQGAKAFRDKTYSVAQQLSESGIDVTTRQRFTTARHQDIFAGQS